MFVPSIRSELYNIWLDSDFRKYWKSEIMHWRVIAVMLVYLFFLNKTTNRFFSLQNQFYFSNLKSFFPHISCNHQAVFLLHLLLRSHPFSCQTFLPWLVPSSYICSYFPWYIQIRRSLFCPSNSFSRPCLCSVLQYTHINGSKSVSGAGFAIIIPSRTFNFLLPHESSILTTEFYEILFRSTYLSSLSLPFSSITIFTDSRNSLSYDLYSQWTHLPARFRISCSFYPHDKTISFC